MLLKIWILILCNICVFRSQLPGGTAPLKCSLSAVQTVDSVSTRFKLAPKIITKFIVGNDVKSRITLLDLSMTQNDFPNLLGDILSCNENYQVISFISDLKNQPKFFFLLQEDCLKS